MKTAIVLITFKKFKILPQILDIISNYNPPKLYVFQDSSDNVLDYQSIEKVADTIQNFNYTFPVEIIRSKVPLKLNKSVISSIDYCFKFEEKLMILEDDIVPSASFFHFCDIMLEKYHNSNNIGCISGCNLGSIDIDSFYFKQDISIPFWGWATWRSKWLNFGVDNYYWDTRKEKILNKITKKNRMFFKNIFDGNSQYLNVWDLQWCISLLACDYKTILPSKNLIANKGFTSDALTTNFLDSKFGKLMNKDLNLYRVKEKSIFVKYWKLKYENAIVEFLTESQINFRENLNSTLNV